MIISNTKTEFYDVISGNRILLLVGLDVDALCSSKILQYLFHCDNVLYTMIPIKGKLDLFEVFEQYKDRIKHVVMINCGGTVDVVDLLQPDNDVVFYIFDTHRPIDVCNIYSDSQVRVYIYSEEVEKIPAYDQIFMDSEDEEDAILTDEVVLKRKNKRLWKENRQKVLFDYSQFTYHGLSSALLMFELSWKLSRDSNELLWWAIIGLTDQFYHGRIEQEKYVLNAASLQSHVSRHNHRDSNSSCADSSCMRLMFEKDVNLVLYRHWSVFESLMHTKYTVCKFRLWTIKGIKKLHEFFAELGVPLPQCKQKFSAMDSIYRVNITTWIENISEKYKLDQIVYGSFSCQFGYKGKFSATDFVLAIAAILESPHEELTLTDNFLCALEALTLDRVPLVQRGIELAKLQLSAMFHQVQSFLDMNHVISAGSFLYAVIEERISDVRFFSYPLCLMMLAHFILEAHAYKSRSQRSQSLPLVLMVLDVNKPGYYLVVGIPPVSEDSTKNFFGKAFEQTTKHLSIDFSQDLFDSSFAHVNENDKSKFFDALISIFS